MVCNHNANSVRNDFIIIIENEQKIYGKDIMKQIDKKLLTKETIITKIIEIKLIIIPATEEILILNINYQLICKTEPIKLSNHKMLKKKIKLLIF